MDIGLYDSPLLESLPGFSSGITLPIFQTSGIMSDSKDKLRSLVRYSTPSIPRCFSISIEIPSGPSALDGFALLMTLVTSDAVKCGVSSARRPRMRRVALLFALSLSGCSANCRLKYLAHLFGSVTVTSPKVTEIPSSLVAGFERALTVGHNLPVPVLKLYCFSSLILGSAVVARLRLGSWATLGQFDQRV
ncbi:uncharacterized protein LOC142232728 [Haematobia irritans]|uniref:uncharacterized protein LOC142232728 n=1 Tax=Haematobia irritans TaxID=7368 RepID=UPI003F50CD23